MLDCHRKLVVLLMMIFCSWLTLHPRVVHAQQSDTEVISHTTRTFTLEELGFREDRVAAGTIANLLYDLPIPRSWDEVELTINLHFSHSSLLLPDLSQMTVLYNDIPLGDVHLTPENETSGWLQIKVPADAVTKGRNQLKVSLYQRLTRDRCADSGTEAGLWTVIHKDSTIRLDMAKPPALDLAWLPEPFSSYGQRALTPVAMTLVLPKQPNGAELRSAGLVAAKLGQMIGMRMLELSIAYGAIPRTGHVVVVTQNGSEVDGLLDLANLPIPLRAESFAEETPILPDEGVLQLTKRVDGTGLLLVTGISGNGLLNAAKALANANSLSMMSGVYAIIKATPQSLQEPNTPQQTTTLEELTSSGNRMVEGTTVEEVSYCFRLPPNWSIEPNARLDLRYSFSPNLWQERSSLAIRLNNTPIARTKLTNNSSGQSLLQIPLPNSEFVDGYNCLRFLFTLRLEQSECATEMGGELWGEIDAQSPILLPYKIDDETPWKPDMRQYPYPFNVDYDLSQTAIVLPARASQSQLTGALALATKIGSEARHPTLHLVVKYANEWEQQEDSQRNLILIGSSEQNPIVKLLDGEPLKLADSNELTLQVRNELFARQQSGAQLAFAEFQNSPWRNGQAILHLSSNNQDAFAALVEVLTRNRQEEGMSGNIVTVSETGIVRSVDTIERTVMVEKVEVTEEGLEVTEPETISSIRPFLLAGLALLSVVVVLLVVLTIRERRNRNKRLSEIMGGR